MTSSLPRKCSTTELRGRNKKLIHPTPQKWSGKRDSNPRPSAWKADALANWAIPASSTNLKIQDGEGRIRTSEGWADRFTVCSLWPLGNLPEILGKTRPQKPVKHLTLNLQRSNLEAHSNQPFKSGAGKGTRTPDLLITNQLLYQLSYASSVNKNPHFTPWFPKLQLKLEVLSYKISNYRIFFTKGWW